ncbi:TPA: hypothetical protein JAJ71_002426 [Corynebacterium striatum]|nr:hypothetical protein [Corynebacterium striatum]
MPENNIHTAKQKPFIPPTTSPTELTNYIGTPPWAMVQARRAPLLPMPRPTPRR